jgi:hypothetical protein
LYYENCVTFGYRKKIKKSSGQTELVVIDFGSMRFEYTDGGRSKYYSGFADGDCVTRAFSIGLNKSYLEIYELVNKISQIERKLPKIKGFKRDYSSAKGGVYPHIIEKLAKHFNLKKKNRKGKIKDIPNGKFLVITEEHIACIRNGILFDTHDCSDLDYEYCYEL